MYLLVTVDTENPQTETLRYGWKTDTLDLFAAGEPCGVTAIMDECEAAGISATFFLNVYERNAFSSVEDIGRYILSRGHDLQLHTHPAWTNDRNRLLMRQYSFDEQVRILNEGVEVFQRMGVPSILAHRAGGYGANLDTLRALGEVGIPIDSSFCGGQPNCALPISAADICTVGSVVEVPMSTWKHRAWLRVPCVGRILMRERWRRLADNAGVDDVLECVRLFCNEGMSMVHIMVHSYSLMSWDAGGRMFRADAGARKRFGAVLRTLADQAGLSPVTLAQLYGSLERGTIPAAAMRIPVFDAEYGVAETLRRLLRPRHR